MIDKFWCVFYASQYLSDDSQLVTEVGSRHLRSAKVSRAVSRTQSQIGD